MGSCQKRNSGTAGAGRAARAMAVPTPRRRTRAVRVPFATFSAPRSHRRRCPDTSQRHRRPRELCVQLPGAVRRKESRRVGMIAVGRRPGPSTSQAGDTPKARRPRVAAAGTRPCLARTTAQDRPVNATHIQHRAEGEVRIARASKSIRDGTFVPSTVTARAQTGPVAFQPGMNQ